MHFIFIPYGMKDFVDKLIRDMQAQKHSLRMHKEGQPDQQLFMESQIRYLPFGIYEYIFPKEDLDIVLTSLLEGNYNSEDDPYKGISPWKISFIRKMIHADKVPEFKRDKKFLWMKEHVGIIPIGVRYDGEITEPVGSPSAGYTHERI